VGSAVQMLWPFTTLVFHVFQTMGQMKMLSIRPSDAAT